jgi:hypothetical protein
LTKKGLPYFLQIHEALLGTFWHTSNVNGHVSFTSSISKDASNGQRAKHPNPYSNLHIWRHRYFKRLDDLAHNNTRCALYMSNMTHYLIETDDLQPWLRWGYWISPFTYAQNAVSINEFLDRRWAKVSIPFN